MELTIRQARSEDAEGLLAHLQRLLREPDVQIPLHPDEFTLTLEQKRQLLSETLNSTTTVFLIAEANGQVIGEINCKRGTRRAFAMPPLSACQSAQNGVIKA